MVFLGTFSAIILLVVVYLLTMAGYFYVRKKNADFKYTIEVATVIFSFGLSFLTKFIILIINDHDCFEDGFTALLNAIYFTIGGLAFDGIDMGVYGMSAINCLYSGTSVYAGMIFLSVVTAKASYDVYSGIRIFMLRLSPSMRKGLVDVYIFSAVTENTLTLARSISERYGKMDGDYDGVKKHAIIFSSASLDTFDRKNPHHCEIMAQGYFYWPFSASGNKQPISLINRLKLHVDNDFTVNNKPFDQLGKIHIFALEENSSLNGLESENSSLVLSEVKCLTAEYIKAPDSKRSIVNFYMLSDNTIDYTFYNTCIKDTVGKTLADLKVSVDDEFYEKLTKFYFQLNVLNEAELAGKSLAQKRNECFTNASLKSSNNLFVKDAECSGANLYRAMVIGFGRTGQCALTELVSSTAYVDEDGKPKQFYADVYDQNADEFFGGYAISHPLCICINMHDEVRGVEEGDLNGYPMERIQNIFSGLDKPFEEIKKEMCLPVIGLHSESSFSYDFMHYLDLKAGDETDDQKCNKSRYNAFIITLGNDEKNIKMANSLIADLKRESGVSNCGNMLQTVYVNIRSGKNSCRVVWSAEDEKRYPNIKVILFGDSCDMYSYLGIIDQSAEIFYNCVYSRLLNKDLQTAKDANEKTALNQIEQALINADDKNYDKAFDELYEVAKKYSEEDAIRKWLELDIWSKKSNNAAKLFGANYSLYLSLNNMTGKSLCQLTTIEHERWIRFHIMSGWAYKNYSKEDKSYFRENKYHNCLCPISMIDLQTKLYDVGNVLIAKK